MKFYTTLFIATLAFASVANASADVVATFSDVSGKVMVNQGDGYVSATNGMELGAGDQIMVSEDASAALRYVAGNCSVELAPQSLATVAAAAPCVSGDVTLVSEGVFVKPANGVAGGPATMIIGGLVVTGVIVGGVFIYLDTEDKPASTPAY